MLGAGFFLGSESIELACYWSGTRFLLLIRDGKTKRMGDGRGFAPRPSTTTARLIKASLTTPHHTILPSFPRFYLVFPLFPAFHRVLPASIQFYRVLPGFTGFYRVLPGFTGFYRVMTGFTGFYRVLPGYKGSYRVLPGYNGFYRVLPVFHGLPPSFSNLFLLLLHF